ncbi:hypothetical protein DMC47_29700, partial [Nostoc sp. 3335mG]
NSSLCAEAYHHGDDDALKAAVAIRSMFQGLPLVAGIKAVLAYLSGDKQWSVTIPPLHPVSREDILPISQLVKQSPPWRG